jgi:hypothetical protein
MRCDIKIIPDALYICQVTEADTANLTLTKNNPLFTEHATAAATAVAPIGAGQAAGLNPPVDLLAMARRQALALSANLTSKTKQQKPSEAIAAAGAGTCNTQTTTTTTHNNNKNTQQQKPFHAAAIW